MKILSFGPYDPAYARNRVLIGGLRANGVDVVECADRSRSALKYLRLAQSYFHLHKDFDAMLVGFPGQEAMFLARGLRALFGPRGIPIIFDAFTSHYGGHVLDRGTVRPESPAGRYYRWIDRQSCRLADVVLLDTQAHIDFFVREFGVPAGIFRRVFVGADTGVFAPQSRGGQGSPFLVHFHGYHNPLQGVGTIVKALKLLEKDDIWCNIIGRGQTAADDRALARTLGASNIRFIEPVPYEELAGHIAKADVCLGIFGDTPKTPLVIPNKIFEALACARPVITADTPAIRELFSDREHLVLCKAADPEDLAEKILLLKKNAALRDAVACGGHEFFKANLTERHLGAALKEIIAESIERMRRRFAPTT